MCETATIQKPLKELCDGIRQDISGIASFVKSFMEHPDMSQKDKYPNQTSEMKANVMLAYRCLEDARMRVGKILQAAGDGVSILDR